MNAEIDNIIKQCVSLYSPEKILLFGSRAKNMATSKSDIDLCIITETINKRELLADMYLNIESDKQFDLLVYTPVEWGNSVSDLCSFAYIINKEGVVLYAR